MAEHEDKRACLPIQDFDREFTLEELISGINRDKLLTSLSQILGDGVWISDCRGGAAVGKMLETATERIPIRVHMDVVGFLHVPPHVRPQAQAAVAWLELLLHSSVRYLMASSLHLQAVHEDYQLLQQKHIALRASEQRYKELSQSLEQKVAEQVQTIEETQRQLYQAEKLASVGQLAAGVAHEINNPIGFIKSNLTTAQSYIVDLAGLLALLQRGSDPQGVQSYLRDKDMDFILEDFQVLLQESIAGAERIATIVSALKGFSAIDRAGDEVCNLNDIIRNTCKMVLSSLDAQVQLSLELAELPAIVGNAGQLGQALTNLLNNAIKAIDKNGRILVESRLQDEVVVVKVADTGTGIHDEIMDKIFDPFFTTADVGQGTGLGLTVVRDIVSAHGGDIKAASSPGKGTVFTLTLPRQRDP